MRHIPLRHKPFRAAGLAVIALAIATGGAHAQSASACATCGDTYRFTVPDNIANAGGASSSGGSSSSSSGIGGKVAGAAIGLIGGFFGSQTNKAVQAWTAHGKQMSANTQTQTQAFSETRNAQTQVLSNTIREAAKTQSAIRMAPPSLPCVTPGLAKQLAAGEILRRQREQELAQIFRAWGNNTDPETRGAGTATALNQASKSLSVYCGAAEAQQGLCTAASPELADANVNAGVLFDQGTIKPALTQASEDYTKLVANPVPPARMPGSSYKTVGGMVSLADRDIRDSRVSIATETVNYINALRSPTMELSQWASGATGGEVAVEGKISANDALYVASVYRLRGDDWYNNMLAGPADGAWKDLAAIRATKLYVNWQRFELKQRRSMLVGAILSTLAQDGYGGTNPVASPDMVSGQ